MIGWGSRSRPQLELGPAVAKCVRVSWAATAVLVAVVVGALPAHAARPRYRCASSGHTITADAKVRVFRVGPSDDYRVYACFRHGGKVRHLGHFAPGAGANEFDGIQIVRVAGRFAAYEDATCDHTGCGGEFKVIDVRTGAVHYHALIPSGDFEIRVLVMNARGSAAWSRRYSVTKFEARHAVVLDGGPQISPDSLTLHGSCLSWQSGNTTKTATLK